MYRALGGDSFERPWAKEEHGGGHAREVVLTW